MDVHLRAAKAVVSEGGVLALFFEGAIGGPPDHSSRPRTGSAFVALLTDAPIVPIALCAEKLYRRKRLSVRILPPTSVAELTGHAPDATIEGSREELRLARALTAALAERVDAAVSMDDPMTVDGRAVHRRWPWLTRLFR